MAKLQKKRMWFSLTLQDYLVRFDKMKKLPIESIMIRLNSPILCITIKSIGF